MIKSLTNKQGFVLYVLCMAQFTLAADIANLSISTSTLVAVFQTNIASIQALGSVQPLVGAALMLSASMLGLKIGWRKLLIVGCALGLLSTLGFLLFDSITLITLVVRPLAGISSALILPSVLALVVAHCQGKRRALGFGLTAASTGLAAAVMPLLSGWLYDNAGWQWPFIIIAFCYGLTLLGAIFQVKPLDTQVKVKFDYFGALLVAISMVLMFIGIFKMPTWGGLFTHDQDLYPPLLQLFFPLSPALLCVGLGVGLFTVFVYQQRRFEQVHGRSILPINWFKNSLCRYGFMILALMYLALGGSSFVIVTYLQVALSLSGSHSGSIILVFSLFMIMLSILTPIAFKTWQARQVCQLAFVAIASCACLLMWSSDAQQINVIFYIGMAMLGSAMGMLASQCPVIITEALGEREAEQSGGLQATLRNIGMVLGLTLFGGINQYLMQQEVRENIPSSIPIQLRADIEQSATIPYLSNQQIRAIAQHYALPTAAYHQLKQVKAKAREKGFNGVMLMLFIVAVLGFELSRRLGHSFNAVARDTIK
ncbi:MFS transporter [Vibrio rarus]|uniref:MFS transporter n=1 Tax=Vibrio rarus TaxID=413403 RepID=UPI0021C3AB18|nr:MFS transporter [Vibrio rarus]